MKILKDSDDYQIVADGFDAGDAKKMAEKLRDEAMT